MNKPGLFVKLGGASLIVFVIGLALACRRARTQAAEVRCVNHMVSICTASHIWASDNEDVLPKTFFSMSNELASPFTLICPSRERPVESLPWDPDADYYDYAIIATNRTVRDGPTPFIRCRIHDHLTGYTDGRVWDGQRWRRKFPN